MTISEIEEQTLEMSTLTVTHNKAIVYIFYRMRALSLYLTISLCVLVFPAKRVISTHIV